MLCKSAGCWIQLLIGAGAKLFMQAGLQEVCARNDAQLNESAECISSSLLASKRAGGRET